MENFTTGHSASKTFKETNIRVHKIVEHGYATLLAGLTIKDEPIVQKNIHHPYQITIPLDKCKGTSITKMLVETGYDIIGVPNMLVETGYDIIGVPMMPIPTRRNTQLYNSFSWTIPRTDDWFETRYEASIANSLLSSVANLLPDILLSRMTTNITQSAVYGLSKMPDNMLQENVVVMVNLPFILTYKVIISYYGTK